MSGWTKGPWTLEEDWTAEIRGADGSLIAKVVYPQKIADARLMRVAPEMFGILEEVAEYLDARQDVNWEGDGPNEAMWLLMEVREILRKAEVKSS